MKRSYRPKLPRLQLRVIAVVMAAATLAVLVVFPAQMETVTALDALILQHR